MTDEPNVVSIFSKSPVILDNSIGDSSTLRERLIFAVDRLIEDVKKDKENPDEIPHYMILLLDPENDSLKFLTTPIPVIEMLGALEIVKRSF